MFIDIFIIIIIYLYFTALLYIILLVDIMDRIFGTQWEGSDLWKKVNAKQHD